MVVHTLAAHHNAIYLMRLRWINIFIIQNIKLIIIYYWILSHQQSFILHTAHCTHACIWRKEHPMHYRQQKRIEKEEEMKMKGNGILTEIFECSKFQFDALNFLAFILLLLCSSLFLHPPSSIIKTFSIPRIPNIKLRNRRA